MTTRRSFRPNPIFEIWRADEVAECMEIPDEIYAKLWNDIVPLQGEVIANDGSWCLAKYWGKLTLKEQIALNIAAVKHNKEQGR